MWGTTVLSAHGKPFARPPSARRDLIVFDLDHGDVYQVSANERLGKPDIQVADPTGHHRGLIRFGCGDGACGTFPVLVDIWDSDRVTALKIPELIWDCDANALPERSNSARPAAAPRPTASSLFACHRHQGSLVPERIIARTSNTSATSSRRPRSRSAPVPPAAPHREPTSRHEETLRRGLTAVQISHLPASIDLVTAARALGIGRTKAYELARFGGFPCAVWRVGRSYRVRTSDLQTFLGLTTTPTPSQPQSSGSRRKEG